jgi:SAM-dependent methyltransferase
VESHNQVRRTVARALWVVAAAHLAEAAVLRGRRWGLAPLDAPLTTPATTGPPTGVGQVRPAHPGKLGLAAVEGVTVDDLTRDAAAYEMDLDGVEVVDLVPGDLPAERALRLLRRLDARRLVDDVMYAPGGAHEALALHPALVERMGGAGGVVRCDRERMVRRTVDAQRYAPVSSVARVAPDLAAGPFTPHDRWRELVGVTAAAQPYASLPPLVVGFQLAQAAALVAGLAVAPAAALAALGAWSAKPALVFGGSVAPTPVEIDEPPVAAERRALRPPDVVAASVRRLPRAVHDAIGAARAGAAEARRHRIRRLSEPPARHPDPATLFEAPLTRCPWCGSPGIVARLDTEDLFQSKPGRFHLDACDDCGHTFQNPALTPAGLEHYYSQFYDGVGEELWEAVFAGGRAHDERRCDAVARFLGPDRPDGPTAWLDVGAGHGHFCLTARQRWPRTRFEGADMGEAIDEAWRRGRIDVAHRGRFIDLAAGLPRTYDVVSMHHYLEHSPDPRAELAAAAGRLAPGGLLEVELPDPGSPWARRLGRYWHPWLQPQHLHLPRCEQVVDHLASLGLEVVSVERGEATLGFDLLGAVGAYVQSRVASSHMPWLDPPRPVARLRRAAVLAAAVPVGLVALIADTVKDAGPLRADVGNAYRIVARVPGGPGGSGG